VDPELIVAILAPLMAAPAAMLWGWRLRNPPALGSARALEGVLWRRLWTPLVPAGAICAALIGWAIAEQRPADEQLTSRAMLLASPFVLVWVRAVARAAFRLRGGEAPPLAATV
jgi:hypothetical protein